VERRGLAVVRDDERADVGDVLDAIVQRLPPLLTAIGSDLLVRSAAVLLDDLGTLVGHGRIELADGVRATRGRLQVAAMLVRQSEESLVGTMFPASAFFHNTPPAIAAHTQSRTSDSACR